MEWPECLHPGERIVPHTAAPSCEASLVTLRTLSGWSFYDHPHFPDKETGSERPNPGLLHTVSTTLPQGWSSAFPLLLSTLSFLVSRHPPSACLELILP